jgi:hypothetical protein
MTVEMSLKLMFFFWQIGFVDTLTLIQFCLNSGIQYSSIVLASCAVNFSDIRPSVLLEPIAGLGVSYRYIAAAKSAAMRRARIATVAAFLSTSGGSMVTANPNTNIAVGSAVATKIQYMRAILARGGGQVNTSLSAKSLVSLKEYMIKLEAPKTIVMDNYQSKFSMASKQIIDNIFNEHTTRRYVQATQGQTLNKILPTSVGSLYLRQAATASVFGWTCFGVLLFGASTVGALYLFQCEKRKRYFANYHEDLLIVFNED